MNILKKIIPHIITFLILIIIFLLTKQSYIFILINILIYIYIYLLFKLYVNKEEEKKYIEKNLKLIEEKFIDTDNIILIIVKNNKIIWGNENAYLKFPHLKQNRSSNFLIENQYDEYLKYNNKVFKIYNKNSMYFLLENTEEYREQKKLQDIQTIIGFLQIDNMEQLKASMDPFEYLNFNVEFEKDLYNFLTKNKIYFNRLENKSFYLNIPYKFLEKSIQNRFLELGEILKKYQEKGIAVTTTMGIAYNYSNIDTTGQKATEALELAISRGGAQIVIFDNEEKYYFGGGFLNKQSSNRLKARIVSNTLQRVLKDKDIVYLVSHKNPDHDALASLILMYEYLKKLNFNVKILINLESNIEKYQLDIEPYRENMLSDYVIDKTKKNILISLDTQSKDIISHPKILEELEDIIIIDHHRTPTNYFRGNIFSWIEPGASSTVELVMGILMATNNVLKNKQINDLAIMGILTDTNRFKYRTTSQTLETLMNLTENNGDLMQSLKDMYLTQDEYLNKQQIIKDINLDYKFSIIDIEQEYDDVLLSIVADDISQIKEKEGALVISKIDNVDNRYKVKIRTNNKISAKNLIEEYGGGGHFYQAAGILNFEQKENLKLKVQDLSEEE